MGSGQSAPGQQLFHRQINVLQIRRHVTTIAYVCVVGNNLGNKDLPFRAMLLIY
jgi:hypothetical protein